jgi:hypothetical protein
LGQNERFQRANVDDAHFGPAGVGLQEGHLPCFAFEIFTHDNAKSVDRLVDDLDTSLTLLDLQSTGSFAAGGAAVRRPFVRQLLIWNRGHDQARIIADRCSSATRVARRNES